MAFITLHTILVYSSKDDTVLCYLLFILSNPPGILAGVLFYECEVAELVDVLAVHAEDIAVLDVGDVAGLDPDHYCIPDGLRVKIVVGDINYFTIREEWVDLSLLGKPAVIAKDYVSHFVSKGKELSISSCLDSVSLLNTNSRRLVSSMGSMRIALSRIAVFFVDTTRIRRRGPWFHCFHLTAFP